LSRWPIGHRAHIEACEGEITIVTLKDTGLLWRLVDSTARRHRTT